MSQQPRKQLACRSIAYGLQSGRLVGALDQESIECSAPIRKTTAASHYAER